MPKALNNCAHIPLLAPKKNVLAIVAVSGILLYGFLQFDFMGFFLSVLALIAAAIFFIAISPSPVSVSSKNRYMPSSNEKQPSRLVIYSNDVQKIHTCSDSTAARKLKDVKDHLGKKDHQVITIAEYCDYWGLDYLQTCYFLNVM